MIKIELVKFEAQDVITASVVAPDYEFDSCVCSREGCKYVDGVHVIPSLNDGVCMDPIHFCGNGAK